jgi:hypothetical protein
VGGVMKILNKRFLIRYRAMLKREKAAMAKHYGIPNTRAGWREIGESDNDGGDSYDFVTRIEAEISVLDDLIDQCWELE